MDPDTLEKLVQQYQNGNRDPELIEQLNQAAWTGFHDPWEFDPGVPIPYEEMAEDPDDPDLVRPFTLDMIERALESRGWRYYKRVGAHPWLTVHINYDPASDRETKLMFAVLGRDRDILHMDWNSDRRTSAERFDRAFRLCNEWNSAYRWPRAAVAIPNLPNKGAEDEVPEEAPSGLLTLDFDLPLAKGIHQDLLNHILGRVIDTGWDFWILARKDYGL